eukprot:1160894-Pelagomonas_calceolata.AAC.6
MQSGSVIDHGQEATRQGKKEKRRRGCSGSLGVNSHSNIHLSIQGTAIAAHAAGCEVIQIVWN